MGTSSLLSWGTDAQAPAPPGQRRFPWGDGRACAKWVLTSCFQECDPSPQALPGALPSPRAALTYAMQPVLGRWTRLWEVALTGN